MILSGPFTVTYLLYLHKFIFHYYVTGHHRTAGQKGAKIPQQKFPQKPHASCKQKAREKPAGFRRQNRGSTKSEAQVHAEEFWREKPEAVGGSGEQK